MHSKVDLIFAPRGTAPALPYSALATKEVDGAARSWSTDTSPRSRIAGRSSDSPRRTGLPAVYAVCEDVDEGGLLSYGANVADISAASRAVRGLHSRGRQARRSSRRAGDSGRTRHNHEDRESARPHDPATLLRQAERVIE